MNNEVKPNNYKNKILILTMNILSLIILFVGLVVSAIYLGKSLPLNENNKYEVFYSSSGLGVSIFLILFVLLNFTSFITNNKELLKYLLKHIFKKRVKHDQ